MHVSTNRRGNGLPTPVDDDPILSPWESRPSADFGNNPEILCADIPSVGTATAHGLATIYNALLQCRLVDDAQLAELSAIAFEGTDQVFGTPARMALGFPIGRIGAPVEEHSTAFGWPGGGGSYAYADPDRRANRRPRTSTQISTRALTTGTDTLTGTDYVIEGVARLVTEEATRETLGDRVEETYGWQLAHEDGTWYGLSDAIRTSTVQLYRVQPDTAFAFTTGCESSRLAIGGADRRRSTH